MKVAIGTDHNGVNLRKEIIKVLESRNYEVLDLSKSNTPLDDYTDYAFSVSEKVRDKEADFGILICGTGIGMSIASNKVKGIKCAHVSNINEASLSREHNDANVIALSSKNELNETIKMIDVFLTTEFKNEERHIRRINKIASYENENN